MPTSAEFHHINEQNSWIKYQNGAINAIIDRSVHTVSFALSTIIDMCYFWTRKLYSSILGPISSRSILKYQMKHAKTYQEWHQAALALDYMSSGVEWKEQHETDDYDYEIIQEKLEQLQKAKELGDIEAMKFLLRTGLHRNIGGILHENLYNHVHTGTKHLVEDYLEQACITLEEVCSKSIYTATSLRSLKDSIQFFKDLKHSYGNTALLLSGGGGMGSYHLGVVKCLIEQDLLPRIISGSSSGSAIASLIATRNLDEIEFDKIFFFIDEPFDPNTPIPVLYRLYRKLDRWLNKGTLYETEHIKETCRTLIGDMTFLEAYYKTRRVLNITVSSSTNYEMPRLLNYLTAPNVIIWSAVICSCSIPRLLCNGTLYSKGPQGQLVPWNETDDFWLDGSIESDLPMRYLSQMFNVNHFIVSQVNPHIVPFLKKPFPRSFIDRTYEKFLLLIKSELQYRLPMMLEYGIFPKFCHMLLSVVSQCYEGDITIAPNSISLYDIRFLFSNTNPERVRHCIHTGEQYTWPKLSNINNNTKIERKIDELLHTLRCKLLDLMYQSPGSCQKQDDSVLIK